MKKKKHRPNKKRSLKKDLVAFVIIAVVISVGIFIYYLIKYQQTTIVWYPDKSISELGLPRVAYIQRNSTENDLGGNIYLTDLNETNTYQITNDSQLDKIIYSNPAMLGADKLVFQKCEEPEYSVDTSNCTIAQLDINTGRISELVSVQLNTSYDNREKLTLWGGSSDGSYIVYSRPADQQNDDYYLLNVHSNTPKHLMTIPTTTGMGAGYESFQSLSFNPANDLFFIKTLAGREQVFTVFDLEGKEHPVRLASGYIGSPSWANDTTLIFKQGSGGKTSIIQYNVITHQRQSLMTGVEIESVLANSKNNKLIYISGLFQDELHNEFHPKLWIMDVNDISRRGVIDQTDMEMFADKSKLLGEFYAYPTWVDENQLLVNKISKCEEDCYFDFNIEEALLFNLDDGSTHQPNYLKDSYSFSFSSEN